MRGRILLLAALGVASFATYSLTQGPEPPGSAVTPARNDPAQNSTTVVPAASRAGELAPVETPVLAPAVQRDLSALSPFNRQMFLACQRGADWLYRMNGARGRFVYGYLPALKAELEGDNFLRQAGAACALGRSAQVLGEPRYAARAAQAVLTLLEETATDAGDPQVRYTVLPPALVNRLGAAGWLVLAINVLPAPQADLLEKSEQLCNYIRRQARPDGSLACDDGEGARAAADPVEAVELYPGPALAALASSHRLKPAAWKLELLRKAVSYYRPWWQAHKSLTFVPCQSAAYAQAFLLTREPAFAGFVFEMSDWTCALQYDQVDPRRLTWYGGFKGWVDGRALEEPPQVSSAAIAEGLVDACRAVREAGDVLRHERYREAVERCLQFVATLQYTEGSTQHFADWYRPRLVGAFHATHQDGNLRIDYTQHAVAALVEFLDRVAR